MTRIEFFFNVEHKMQIVAELSEKALGKNRRLMVFSPDAASAEKMQQFLWTHSALSFMPSCRPESPLADATPIIVDWQGTQLVHDDVLVNMQNQHPPFFSRFRRLIEIVGNDEADKTEARLRYKFYRDRGYEIRTFDSNGASL
ncbi:MAG: DNA polymerase III subunit chi [Methylophilaceae bacterium]